MALAISTVPMLTGQVAEKFVRRAQAIEQRKKRIDFSEEIVHYQEFEQKNQAFIIANSGKEPWAI